MAIYSSFCLFPFPPAILRYDRVILYDELRRDENVRNVTLSEWYGGMYIQHRASASGVRVPGKLNCGYVDTRQWGRGVFTRDEAVKHSHGRIFRAANSDHPLASRFVRDAIPK